MSKRRIDDAVGRFLRVKFRAGLSSTVRECGRGAGQAAASSRIARRRAAAGRSLVLLTVTARPVLPFVPNRKRR